MKKFLVVLLALVMVFGLATTAFAADTQIPEFNDISSQSQITQDSIQRLAVLGVLQGNDGLGGAYRPGDTLTRAEFAKIICLLSGVGNEKTADAYKSSPVTMFSDVSAGNWYTGWVALASEAGYFKGDTNGAFRPNATITMQEVSTVMLRVVGYDDHLGGGGGGNFGTWPANYNTKARDVGLADDVVYAGTTNVTRGDMAIMANNMVDLHMVTYVSDSYAANQAIIGETGDRDWFVEVSYRTNEDDTENMTILKKAFDSIAVTVRFAEASGDKYDEIAAWSYDDFVDGQFAAQIASRRTSLKNDTWVTDGRRFLVADSYFITRDFNFPELANMTAKITYKDDSKREISFIQVTSSYELAKEIYKDGTRVNVDGKSLSTSSHPLYASTTNPSFRDLSLTDDANVRLYNNTDKDNKVPAKVYLDDNGYVYGVKNYNSFDRVSDFGIYEDLKSGVAYYKSGLTDTDWDIESAKKEHSIYRDGKFITVEDLEENDVVYYMGNIGVKFYLAYSPVAGELTRQTETKLTVSGFGYRGTGINNITGTSAYVYFSEDGSDTFETYVLDAAALSGNPINESYFGDVVYVPAYNFAKLAYVATSESATKYFGVITEVGYSSTWKNNRISYTFRSITVLNAEGKEVTYNFESDFKDDYNDFMEDVLWDQDNSNPVGTTSDWEELSSYFPTNYDTKDLITGFEEGFTEGMMLKLGVNSKGELTSVEKAQALAPISLEEVKVERAKSRLTFPAALTGGSTKYYTLADDAIVFRVGLKEDNNTPSGFAYNNSEVMSVSSILAADFDTYQIVAFDVNKNLASEIKVLYVVMEGSKAQMGVISASGYSSSKYRYTIDGTANIPAKRHTTVPSFAIFKYNSDGEATVDKNYVNKVSSDTYNISNYLNANQNDRLKELARALWDVDYEDLFAASGSVSAFTGSINSGTITLSGVEYGTDNDSVNTILTTPVTSGLQYTLTSSTYLYNLGDDKVITNLNELKNYQGDGVVVIAENNEALYVIANYKVSSTTSTTPSGASGTAQGLSDTLATYGIPTTVTGDMVVVTDNGTLFGNVTIPTGVTLAVSAGKTLYTGSSTLTVGGTLNLSGGGVTGTVDYMTLTGSSITGATSNSLLKKGHEYAFTNKEWIADAAQALADDLGVTVQPNTFVVELNASLSGINSCTVAADVTLNLATYTLTLTDTETLTVSGTLNFGTGSNILATGAGDAVVVVVSGASLSGGANLPIDTNASVGGGTAPITVGKTYDVTSAGVWESR